VPLGPGRHPLTELGGLVPVQLGDEGQRQREGAVAALALRLPEDQPATAYTVDAAPDGEGVGERSP
jgi:hypothetical protein